VAKNVNGKFDVCEDEYAYDVSLRLAKNLLEKGAEVFGNEPKFDLWLNTENLALGNIKPKSLFDSTFGINLLIDELTRIEHGVLA